MVVIVTNLTDAPGHAKGPNQVDIYNRTLGPGESLKLPADLVTKKLRTLAEGKDPLIAIGSLPPWYVAAKKRKGKPLSDEEKQKMISPAPAKKSEPVIQMKQPEGKNKKLFPKDAVPEVIEEVVPKVNKG